MENTAQAGIPPEAIALLKSDVSKAAQFDEVFGQGSAAFHLKPVAEDESPAIPASVEQAGTSLPSRDGEAALPASVEQAGTSLPSLDGEAAVPETPAPQAPATAPAPGFVDPADAYAGPDPDALFGNNETLARVLGPTVGGIRDTIKALSDTGTAVVNTGLDAASAATEATVGKKIDYRFQPVDFAEVASGDSVVGDLTRGGLRYGLGFVGGVRALQSVKGLGSSAKALVGSFIGDAVVTGTSDKTLSNMIVDLGNEYPALANPISDFLAVSDDAGLAERKFKTALEGALIGPVVDIVFSAVKGIRNIREARGSSEETLAKIANDAAQEVEGAIKVAETSPVNVEAFPEIVKQADPLSAATKIADPLSDATKIVADSTGPGGIVTLKDTDLNAVKEAVRLVSRPEPFKMADHQLEALRVSMRAQLETGAAIDPSVLAGAFNPRYMDSSATVMAVIRDGAHIFKEEANKLRGGNVTNLKTGNLVQTHEAVKELGEMFGEKPAEALAKLSRFAKDADEMAGLVNFAKTFTQSLTRDIHEIATKIDNGIGGKTAELELMRRADILKDVHTNLWAIQSNAARTTSAGRIRTSDAFSPEELTKLIDEAGGGENIRVLARRIRLTEGDPKSMVRVLNTGIINKVLAAHNTIYLNGILSGVKTHVVNFVSNVTKTLWKPMDRMVGSALIADKAGAVEGARIYAGMYHGVLDALEMSRRAFRTETSFLDPSFRTVEADTGRNLHINDAPVDLVGVVKSVKDDGFGATGDVLKYAANWLGKATRLPTRFLMTSDEFFKQLNYRAVVYAKAASAADAQGLKGAASSDYIKKALDTAFERETYQALRTNKATGKVEEQNLRTLRDATLGSGTSAQGAGKNKDALQYAREATFTQDLKTNTWIGNKSIGETFSDAAGRHPVLRGSLLPFVRTPANIIRDAVDHGPTAVLRKQNWDDFMAGGTKRADVVGRIATGSLLWAVAGMMAAEGKITGSGPGDAELTKTKKENGWQPYSYMIDNDDGTTTYVPLARFDPFGIPFGIMADIYQVANKVDEKTFGQLASAATLALAQNLSSKSYLTGITETVSMLGRGYNKEAILDRWIQRRVASYIPAYANLYTGDAEMKDIRDWVDALKAKIPGLSSSVPAHRDLFGKKMELPGGWPMAAINPFSPSTSSGDTVKTELERLASSSMAVRVPRVSSKISNALDLKDWKNASGQTAYDRWQELHATVTIGGKTMYEALDALMSSDSYQKRPEGDHIYKDSKKVDLIRGTMERYHKKTYLELQHDPAFPGLRQAIQTDKLNKKQVKYKGADAAKPLRKDAADTFIP